MPELRGDEMPDTQELAREGWSEYLDAVSLELFNTPVSIEITPATRPSDIQGEHLALQTVAYDAGNDVFEFAATQDGRRPPGLMRHLVDHPARIAVDSRTLLAPMTIAVDGREGGRTVIRIERGPEQAG
jgi:uncharacterized protein DUF5335